MDHLPGITLPVEAEQWANWRQWIRGDPDNISARLLIHGERLHRQLRDQNLLYRDFWTALDVDVDVAPLPDGIAGTSGIIAERRVVRINARDDRRRQRFTVAHELAHFLLPDAPSRWATGSAAAEKLCDEFAARLLTSATELAHHAGDLHAFQPTTLITVAANLRLSLSATVTALNRLTWPENRTLLLIRSYTHRASSPIAPRISARAGGTTYFPLHRRLSSVGLNKLHHFAVTAPGTPTPAPTDDREFPLPIAELSAEPLPRSATGVDEVNDLRDHVAGRWIPVTGSAAWNAYSGGKGDAKWVVATLDLAVEATPARTLTVRRTRGKIHPAAGQQPLTGPSVN